VSSRPPGPPLPDAFFDRPPVDLAMALVGKVLRRRLDGLWLAASIVEAEAYAIDEKGSHSSLGRTPSREPMFAPPGTLYLYHSQGGDSLNLSARGGGNAVLVKSGVPWVDAASPEETLDRMHALSPRRSGERRPAHRLCAGQALLCRALDLRVREWTGRRFDPASFFLEDVGRSPRLVQARRLGIPAGRDEHLPWRFIDRDHVRSATKNPLTRRGAREGADYRVLESGAPPVLGSLPPSGGA